MTAPWGIPRRGYFVSEMDPGLPSSQVPTHPSFDTLREGRAVEFSEQLIMTDHIKCLAHVDL